MEMQCPESTVNAKRTRVIADIIELLRMGASIVYFLKNRIAAAIAPRISTIPIVAMNVSPKS